MRHLGWCSGITLQHALLQPDLSPLSTWADTGCLSRFPPEPSSAPDTCMSSDKPLCSLSFCLCTRKMKLEAPALFTEPGENRMGRGLWAWRAGRPFFARTYWALVLLQTKADREKGV